MPQLNIQAMEMMFRQVKTQQEQIRKLNRRVLDLEQARDAELPRLTERELQAAALLRELLASGPVDGPKVKAEIAKVIGADHKPVYAAARKIGVRIQPAGFAKPRIWSM